MSRAKYNSVTSKEDRQKNKLDKHCSMMIIIVLIGINLYILIKDNDGNDNNDEKTVLNRGGSRDFGKGWRSMSATMVGRQRKL